MVISLYFDRFIMNIIGGLHAEVKCNINLFMAVIDLISNIFYYILFYFLVFVYCI